MSIEVGQVEAIYRYPVKSMRGEQLDGATLGWHGLEGDRRFAFRRVDEHGGNPWLSAGRLADLVYFSPLRQGKDGDGPPTHVRTPDGVEMDLLGDALAAEIERRHGAPVQMMQLRHGIFDEESISLITSATVGEICRSARTKDNVRRFRPNLLIRSTRDAPFDEDAWVGGVLTFGDEDDAPAVTVTRRDLRCSMVNLDPDLNRRTPEVMKACARANENHAGVYGTVTRTGRLAAGQPIVLHR